MLWTLGGQTEVKTTSKQLEFLLSSWLSLNFVSQWKTKLNTYNGIKTRIAITTMGMPISNAVPIGLRFC